jgi:hypothetical protein
MMWANMTIAPYQERPIRFLQLWQRAGWRLTVYGIAHGNSRATGAAALNKRSTVRRHENIA